MQLGTIQIELLKDREHPIHRQLPALRPHDEIQVFHTSRRSIENHLEQQIFFPNQVADQPKIPGIELLPTSAAGQMLEALQSAEDRPVSAIPVGNRRIPQIFAALLAFDPLVSLSFPATFFIHAERLHWSNSPLARRANADSNQPQCKPITQSRCTATGSGEFGSNSPGDQPLKQVMLPHQLAEGNIFRDSFFHASSIENCKTAIGPFRWLAYTPAAPQGWDPC